MVVLMRVVVCGWWCTVWLLQVHFATVERLQMSHNVVMTSLLNELRGGLFDGWMRDEIKTKRPDVWEARQLDKLNYR